MRRPSRSLLPAAALLLLTASPPYADLSEGQRAYERGDYPAAYREWYALADSGSAAAQFLIGLMYEQGRGVPRDLAQAVMWYRRAAEQNDVYAQFRLGFLYAHGRGVNRDDAEAVEWYGRAARQGNQAAQSMVDQMLAEGRGLAPGRSRRDSEHVRQAAEQGVASAQYQLARQYATGQGAGKDYAEAVKWFRRAAEQGLATAQYQLGLRYANGEGVTRDYAEAVKWYRRAAEQGVAFAQFNLGVRYANGQGVDRDPALAYVWFSIAAQGLSGAEAEVAGRARDAIKGALSPAQIARGEGLVKTWRPEPETPPTSATRPTPPH